MRAFLLFLLLLALVTLAWSRGRCLPDRYDPWATLDLRAPPDWFVRYKLARLGDDPAACRAALTGAGARFEALPDHVGADGCGWTDAVRLRGTGVATLQRPAIVGCPLAASLVLLDLHVLQPAGRQLFGSPVVGIDHVGSYACRNIYHRAQAPLSAHARAEAIDLTGFRLADGREVSVAASWNEGGATGAFLHRVHDWGCGVAGMLLGPDYNAAHHTHFHLEQPGWGYCR